MFKKDDEIEINEIETEEEDQQMNTFFRLSSSLSSRLFYIYYSILISNNAEEKKNIKVEKDRQHVSSSVKKETEENIFIFDDKMTASLMSNNFRKFKKKAIKA